VPFRDDGELSPVYVMKVHPSITSLERKHIVSNPRISFRSQGWLPTKGDRDQMMASRFPKAGVTG